MLYMVIMLQEHQEESWNIIKAVTQPQPPEEFCKIIKCNYINKKQKNKKTEN